MIFFPPIPVHTELAKRTTGLGRNRIYSPNKSAIKVIRVYQQMKRIEMVIVSNKAIKKSSILKYFKGKIG
jgi:hypothetical protein